jgi:hypothetical protein
MIKKEYKEHMKKAFDAIALLKRMEELFTEKLQAKTGWGRNEILTAYKEAVNEAILEMLDT